MGAVKLPYLPFYTVAIHRMMKVSFGGTDENLHSFNVIGQKPNQTYGKDRDLALSFAEESIYQFTAA